MGWYIVAFIAAAIVFLAVTYVMVRVFNGRVKKQPEYPPYRMGRPLLSDSEKKFYAVLKSIAPEDLMVFPKVRVSDVIQPIADAGSKEWQFSRKRISIKHFDFVVCDKTTFEVKFVVELNRSISQSREERIRNSFLQDICNEARLSLKKVRVSQSYEPSLIKRELFGHVTTEESFHEPVTLYAKTVIPVWRSDYAKTQIPLWRSYDLEMTHLGFVKAANLVGRTEKQRPQVYVHVGVEGNLNGQVIRVGSAKNGIFRCWFRSTNGHMSAFFWSVGLPSEFNLDSAKRHASYILFLASMRGQKTALKVMSCNSRAAMLMTERALTSEFDPIWDQFARSLDQHSGKTPKRDLSKPSIVNAISNFGMADRLLMAQRKQQFDCWQGLPDVFAAQIKSGKLWQ